MKILKVVMTLALALLFISQVVQASQEPEAELSLGEQLVRQLWADMKARNIEAIEKMIAPGFQSVHEDGSRDREAEIELIKGLDLGEYTLSDFVVTENGPVIVVSYFVSVEETIEGESLSTEPAARLSVWLNTNGVWQWIIHANLKQLKK